MTEVKLQGNPVTVAGTLPAPGDKAPDFTLTNQDLEEKSLSDFSGKRKVLG